MLWRHELTPAPEGRETNAVSTVCFKNLDYAAALPLAQQVDYLPGQVISKTLAQNSAFGLTLFAIDKGEEISAHRSTGDALVIALDGTGEITIDDTKHMLHAGECIVMPAGHPHAVRAPEAFKMLLIVVFPPESATD